ncbi:MAG: DUF1028 domain-containing protein [Flavobacterium sp.]
MKTQKIYFTILVLFSVITSVKTQAQDTFSIIAMDSITKEIGSAGATCIQGIGERDLSEIITQIIPGVGGMNSQAWVCIPNINLQNGMKQMALGKNLSEIVAWLKVNDSCRSQNFNAAYRQYGLVMMNSKGKVETAGYTGSSADDYKADLQGKNYSIQGNILLNETVLKKMEQGFLQTNGNLAEKLMGAMQGANFAGADARCLEAGTSSTIAYLVVYKATDDTEKPCIKIWVGEQPKGVEPITELQKKWDAWKKP